MVREQERHGRVPDRGADRIDGLLEIGVVAVEVRHDDRARPSELARGLHLLAQVVADRRRAADDADHEVGREQRPACLGDELGIAGRVEEGPGLALPERGDRRELQRVALLVLLRLRIANARLVGDGTFAR
jgi:hypothetical protein